MIGRIFRGDVLRALRVEAGLTQRKLGDLTVPTISWHRISLWERGVEQPGPVYIPLLATALSISPLDLLVGGRDEPTMRTLRLAAGLSLKAMSAASGVSYSTCQRLDQGTGRLTPDSAASLAVALGVTTAEIKSAAER